MQSQCSNMLANILPAYPPPQTHTHLTLGKGSKGQNPTFSEHGHVSYQIKWNRKCSNNKHIFCPYTHPQPLG